MLRLLKNASAIAAAVLLVACAPMNTRDQAPAEVFESAKSAKDVAVCISDAWDAFGTPAQMRPIKDGYSVSWINPAWGFAALVVDVADRSSGSQSTYFKKLVLGEGRHDRVVRECQ